MLSAQCKHIDQRGVQAVILIRAHDVLSHSDAAYICIFWEETTHSRHSFDHVLRSCWGDYLGDQQRVNPSVRRHFLPRFIPDSSIGITVPLLFIVVDRSGRFAVSDQPTISEVLASAAEGNISVQVPVSYHMGVRA